MPNWCVNTLRVSFRHPDALVEFMKDVELEEAFLDFERIAPAPEHLRDNGDWYCENWGTSGNAYNPYRTRVNDRIAVYDFYTRWSPPVPILERLAELYPHGHFRLSYWESGAGFSGWVSSSGKSHYNNRYRGRKGG